MVPDTISSLARQLPWNKLGRWWVVGVLMFLLGLPMLYLFTDVLHVPLMPGTLATAEITTLIRFGINDRWVFGETRATWMRLWQFHAACAGGAAVWWAATNALAHFGVYYLLASVGGTCCSVSVNMLTNFLWVWRERRREPSPGICIPPQ